MGIGRMIAKGKSQGDKCGGNLVVIRRWQMGCPRGEK